jgi:hypothetical protein
MSPRRENLSISSDVPLPPGGRERLRPAPFRPGRVLPACTLNRGHRSPPRSPGLLLVQPDLGLHAPESGVINVDESRLCGLTPLFDHRLLKTLKFHLLDAGHFALESDGDLIVRLMRDFLGRHVAARDLSPNQEV